MHAEYVPAVELFDKIKISKIHFMIFLFHKIGVR